MRSYREAPGPKGPVLFDRGIPDVMGYLLLCQLSVPAHIEKAAQDFRYNQQVFLAPPWAEIYTKDNERKQSEAEATATYDRMVTVYSKLGYQINLLPFTNSGRTDAICTTVHFVILWKN